MNFLLTKSLKQLLTLTTTILVIASCTGGDGGGTVYSGGGYGGGTGSGTGGSSTYGSYMSPNETVDQFVSALNTTDGTYIDPSVVMLYENETFRSATPGEEQWFVIYDSKFNEYKSVSLQYVRSIVYYDYYSNSTALATEFRDIESTDIFNGDLNGDFFGDNYEVSDDIGGGIYQGRNSGMLYDDEEDTEDVILEMKDSEVKKFAESASKISYLYKVDLPTAMSIYTLGVKSKNLIKKGELTLEDQLSLASDLEKMTGKNAQEILGSLSSVEKRDTLLKDVAKKLGTTEDSLQNRILPDFFGLSL